MNSIEMQFFETYKSLEKLCNDMYGEKGINVYIQTMESISSREKYCIAEWNDFYYTLKHLRWLRNQIAHPNSDDYEVTEKDMADIKHIYNALLRQQDPLAVLHKRVLANQARETARQTAPPANNKGEEDNHLSPAVIAAIAILIILFLIGYLLWNFGT